MSQKLFARVEQNTGLFQQLTVTYCVTRGFVHRPRSPHRSVSITLVPIAFRVGALKAVMTSKYLPAKVTGHEQAAAVSVGRPRQFYRTTRLSGNPRSLPGSTESVNVGEHPSREFFVTC